MKHAPGTRVEHRRLAGGRWYDAIVSWYDRSTRSWVVQRLDAEGNQIETADYVHSRGEADKIVAQYQRETP